MGEIKAQNSTPISIACESSADEKKRISFAAIRMRGILERKLRLAQNTFEHVQRQIKTVMAWNSHAKMRLAGVSQLDVTPGLMMNLETCF